MRKVGVRISSLVILVFAASACDIQPSGESETKTLIATGEGKDGEQYFYHNLITVSFSTTEGKVGMNGDVVQLDAAAVRKQGTNECQFVYPKSGLNRTLGIYRPMLAYWLMYSDPDEFRSSTESIREPFFNAHELKAATFQPPRLLNRLLGRPRAFRPLSSTNQKMVSISPVEGATNTGNIQRRMMRIILINTDIQLRMETKLASVDDKEVCKISAVAWCEGGYSGCYGTSETNPKGFNELNVKLNVINLGFELPRPQDFSLIQNN